jgi:acetyl-CoA carboxylase biotin carboxylase subunit
MVIGGVDTTIPLFQKLLQEPDILSGDYDIHWLENFLKPSNKPSGGKASGSKG